MTPLRNFQNNIKIIDTIQSLQNGQTKVEEADDTITPLQHAQNNINQIKRASNNLQRFLEKSKQQNESIKRDSIKRESVKRESVKRESKVKIQNFLEQGPQQSSVDASKMFKSPPKFMKHSHDIQKVYKSEPRRQRNFSVNTMHRTKAIYTEVMRVNPHDWNMYRKVHGLDACTKIFVCSNTFRFVREELTSRGWHQNKRSDSTVFHARFKARLDMSIKELGLMSFQKINLYGNQKALTTKIGLA